MPRPKAGFDFKYHSKGVKMAEDIVDELNAKGDPLSLRAARYISVKRAYCEGLERDRRALAQRSLAWEQPEHKPGSQK